MKGEIAWPFLKLSSTCHDLSLAGTVGWSGALDDDAHAMLERFPPAELYGTTLTQPATNACISTLRESASVRSDILSVPV